VCCQGGNPEGKSTSAKIGGRFRPRCKVSRASRFSIHFVSIHYLVLWWGETMSLNCWHQWAYYSSSRWYMGMEGDGGMILTGDNRITRRKPVPVQICPPHIPHGLTHGRSRASAVKGRRLTAWAMAMPIHYLVLHSFSFSNFSILQFYLTFKTSFFPCRSSKTLFISTLFRLFHFRYFDHIIFFPVYFTVSFPIFVITVFSSLYFKYNNIFSYFFSTNC
jgi:hypothetical protein